MRFSIILPLHNSEKFCEKALKSIESQTFEDYELIPICDACTDNTEYITKGYTTKVEVVDYGNPGLARSHGLEIAKGDYILFMDDDDWWLHEYVLDMIDKRLTDEDVLCFGFIWKGRGYAGPVRQGGHYWPAVWNKCWKRSAIGDTRFPADYGDDFHFHVKMMAKQPRIKTWDMPLYYYNYWREGSISVAHEPDLRGIPIV